MFTYPHATKAESSAALQRAITTLEEYIAQPFHFDAENIRQHLSVLAGTYHSMIPGEEPLGWSKRQLGTLYQNAARVLDEPDNPLATEDWTHSRVEALRSFRSVQDLAGQCKAETDMMPRSGGHWMEATAPAFCSAELFAPLSRHIQTLLDVYRSGDVEDILGVSKGTLRDLLVRAADADTRLGWIVRSVNEA